jgi:cytochrome P450
MTDTPPIDPFAAARAQGGYLGDFGGEAMPVLTGWREVRAAAKDWARFSNDGPGRVPVPAETDIRSLRQLPIEIDPPLHGAYKALVADYFRRPLKDAALQQQIADVVDAVLDRAIGAGPVDAVAEIALPIQSRALACLLGLPLADAEEWIGWGAHAFKSKGRNDPARANRLMQMLEGYVDRAMADPGGDFFGHLARVTFNDRRLTRDEILGFAHVTFAGGRDTVIHVLAGGMAHLGQVPADLQRLHDQPDLAARATEELVRYLSPLTHIGRICSRDDTVADVPRAAGERISLCWAAANFDTTVFDAPKEMRLDRNPNPHVGFGSGDHNCLGSAHARLVIRTLLLRVAARVCRVDVVQAVPGTRDIGGIVRAQGHERLILTFHARD